MLVTCVDRNPRSLAYGEAAAALENRLGVKLEADAIQKANEDAKKDADAENAAAVSAEREREIKKQAQEAAKAQAKKQLLVTHVLCSAKQVTQPVDIAGTPL